MEGGEFEKMIKTFSWVEITKQYSATCKSLTGDTRNCQATADPDRGVDGTVGLFRITL